MEKKEVNELVINRLKKERKDWRSDHPFGFVAKPLDNPDGTTNMLKWHCEIPGPKDSPWEGGVYNLSMDFSHDFPVRYLSSYADPPSASSSPSCRTPTSTPQAQSVSASSTRRRIGNLTSA
jgi:hypothetical protein